ncbi:MAG TPA: SRPBCC family protein [Thermomicrobiales bacterium]|nr:SRPBCC family protein [Thermomicrobiales bacterium]
MQAIDQSPRIYERSRLIQVGPDAVYDYVSDIRNLPNYLPTVRNASSEGEDRVRIDVDVQGHRASADGYLRGDSEKRRLEWASDPDDYRGEMIVSDEVGKSRVIVRLQFAARSGYPQRIEGSTTEPDPIDEGLEAALDSIKNILEGEGGKVVPNAAD